MINVLKHKQGITEYVILHFFPLNKALNIFIMIIRIAYALFSLINLVIFVFLAGIEFLLRQGVFTRLMFVDNVGLCT